MEQIDDSSHYEVSLTAGQALIAFVLLLFSLGASFAFGVVVGKGRGEERLVVQQARPVISESSPSAGSPSRIVELGGSERQPSAVASPAVADELKPPVIDELPARVTGTAVGDSGVTYGGEATPFFAQLLSTSEPARAEAIAARLIESGFTNAFVDRATTEQGTVYRVRLKYANEAAARAAVEQLKPFATGEIWITSR